MISETVNRHNLSIKPYNIIFFIVLWFILYIEPLQVGSLKFSQLWKATAVAFLLIYIFKHKIPIYLWIGILFSIKYLIYAGMPLGFIQAIQEFLESLIFPIFLGFLFIFYSKKRNSLDDTVNLAILLSLFIIFSTIPFLLGIKSLNPVTDLASYGIEGSATKGLFYHIATASKLYTISTIVIITTYRRFSKNIFYKLLWLTSVGLGVYFVYSSWTRTAWFIFMLVLVINLFYASNLKKKFAALIILTILFLSISYIYETSQAFRWRLSGGAVYRKNTELNIEQLAGARLPFIIVAIDNLKEAGFGGQLIGYGTIKTKALFKEKTGLEIVSHNRTFEIIESSGYIGLLLYIIFIYSLFMKLHERFNRVSMELKKLTISCILLFFGFFITSHGTPFWGEIIYAYIFSGVLLNLKSKDAAAKAINVPT